MPKHIHADLISEYARLSHITDRPWEYFEMFHGGDWCQCYAELIFWSDYKYRLKPRTIKIGEYDVPEPLRCEPEIGQPYFLVRIDLIQGAREYRWDGDDWDMMVLKSGLIHLDRESAELHAKALIALTQKKE
ncbi:hypothetical protein [Xenorhabdus sp. KJ12.1]|uniref:hypothetical protein n=1 Tax=Xenorhabdus sp. KJ12.1 TaxID=1851571 RepID=UPI000C03F24F|nr:hypothetical protein [Xenorhabdus sp. KJ12.1]PHM70377.1 hypothetical protein Xekj_02005 [Xenorhabdus sp. KJ12.1]